jgi:hypothetical protein
MGMKRKTGQKGGYVWIAHCFADNRDRYFSYPPKWEDVWEFLKATPKSDNPYQCKIGTMEREKEQWEAYLNPYNNECISLYSSWNVQRVPLWEEWEEEDSFVSLAGVSFEGGHKTKIEREGM